MEPNMKLFAANMPRAMGALTHSNQFLKIANLASFAISFVMLALAFYQAAKPPVVLSFSPDATLYDEVKMPSAEQQISQAVRAYVNLRYKWDAKSVADRLHKAEVFIQPQNRKGYEAAIAEVIHFSTEKGVSQRVYPTEPVVNLESKTVTLTGDRITAVQGLKAAGDLKLELSFESGPRTRENPWGVYITKEKEI